MGENLEFVDAKCFLGRVVRVEIDRPLGSRHPRWGFIYPVNYGFVPDTPAPDGDDLDAYVQECMQELSEGRESSD